MVRAKGILDIAGEDRRLVFQAVHMILEGDYQRDWKAGEARSSRMVFIGRNLDEGTLFSLGSALEKAADFRAKPAKWW